MRCAILITLVTLVTLVTLIATPCFSETIIGDYPICKTPEASKDFGQAKMFNNWTKIEQIIASESCVFAEPDVKATVIDRGMHYNVMVFKPYGGILKGWTDPKNVK